MQLGLFSDTCDIIKANSKAIEVDAIYWYALLPSVIKNGYSIFDFRIIKHYRDSKHLVNMLQVHVMGTWYDAVLLDVNCINHNGHVVSIRHYPMFNRVVR